ncbi:MAG: hypothetical protein ABS41_04435 [Arenimonas sp. SCN 70-307]|mgnify:CR=1 FL=1|uniref:DUF4234 domain-containing protein n=1 Tax=Arenimonas sp. SCN 70-307 TaxID=1660089 RepID=UPI00086DABFA|nr:DUF4234 domain-containing protein [Arenimonas sp. SCN 70-307]ODS63899.1 MAG: hypothetical protein ABS41_04435 [Arenimonas sp. SCN 70-307]
MLHDNLIRDLKVHSTWRLLGLSLITYGVYQAHYIVRQTRTMNTYLPGERKISMSFVMAILALSYITLGLFIGFWFVDEHHPIAVAGNFLDLVWALMVLFWGFYARNRINAHTAARRGEAHWFSGLWTLLFTPLYFNYKINVLSSGGDSQRIAA